MAHVTQQIRGRHRTGWGCGRHTTSILNSPKSGGLPGPAREGTFPWLPVPGEHPGRPLWGCCSRVVSILSVPSSTWEGGGHQASLGTQHGGGGGARGGGGGSSDLGYLLVSVLRMLPRPTSSYGRYLTSRNAYREEMRTHWAAPPPPPLPLSCPPPRLPVLLSTYHSPGTC